MGVGADHSTESLGMASSMVTLFRGGVLLGMLLAISGAASPWAGEDGSQLASHQSFLANNGVRSVMKRGAGEVNKKRKVKRNLVERQKRRRRRRRRRRWKRERKRRTLKRERTGKEKRPKEKRESLKKEKKKKKKS